uniref:DUF4112 domain-containing protein n=1 Tax=Prevotella sp. GTC17253 TaxID=3236793 RepID=A0AB33IUG0_9BACT
MTNQTRKDNLKKTALYGRMKQMTQYLDQYYLDAFIGFVPGGIGDTIAALFSLVHIYFSLFKLRSIPLTLAILNNTLRDVLLGLIPFYIGNVADFFHRANSKNMQLVDGFINDDKAIINEVNRKAALSVLTLIVLILMIIGMIWGLIWLAKQIYLIW